MSLRNFFINRKIAKLERIESRCSAITDAVERIESEKAGIAFSVHYFELVGDLARVRHDLVVLYDKRLRNING